MFFEELSAATGAFSAAVLTSVRANADRTAVVTERIVRLNSKTNSTEAARNDDGDDPVVFTAPPSRPSAPARSIPPEPPVAEEPPPVPPPGLPEGFDVDERESKAAAAARARTARSDRSFGAGFAAFLAKHPLVVAAREAPMRVLPFHPCRKPCVNRGRCNFQTGACDCPSGWRGVTCGERDAFPCDDPSGRAVISRCAGTCDETNNRCECGSETPYPKRQIGSWCQPDLVRDRGVTRESWQDPRAFTANKNEPFPYHWVFGVAAARAQANLTESFARGEVDDEVTRGTKDAWCFANMSSSAQTATGALDPAAQCSMACPPGIGNAPNCDVALPGTYCPNQCFGRGECLGGFCACEPEWWGADCSLSARGESVPATAHRMLEGSGATEKKEDLDAEAADEADDAADDAADADAELSRRASPLVYVYEVDPEFHSGQHQRRKTEHDCVPRRYAEHENAPDPERTSRWYYSLETTFHEFLSRSAHRTTDPAEADYFFAPIASACFNLRYNRPSPRHWAADLEVPSRPFGVFTFWDAYARALRARARDPSVAAARAAKGYATPPLDDDFASTSESLDVDFSDHLFVTPYDEGACVLPPSLRTGVFLTHWGNDGSTHARSTAGFSHDRWHGLLRPTDRLRGWRCYDPAKDLVVPPWNRRVAKTSSSGSKASKTETDPADPRFWARGLRNATFFFAGDLGTAEGIPRSGPHADPRYSLGIRQRVTKLLRDREDEGFFVSGRDERTYEPMLQSSTFCGAFPGDGWSGGILAYVRFGCVPVIVLDGVDMPFERVGAFRSPNDTLGTGWDTEWRPFAPEPTESVSRNVTASALEKTGEGANETFPRKEKEKTKTNARLLSEPLLDYASFSVRVAERDIERLDVILKRFTDAEVRELQRGVEDVRALFSYDVPDQPARGGTARPRREDENDENDENATELARLKGGGAADLTEPGVWGGGVGEFPGVPWDAFEMIMASLRYKLELRDREKGGEGGS